FTIEQTSRACCVCKKLFCCAQCCERHQKKKHANLQLDCPLCASEKLPLKAFEDKSLFYHIVIAHLPLYCYLCGETFKNSKDLESFGTCNWWKSRHRHSLVTEQESVLGTPPLTSDEAGSTGFNGNFGPLTSPPELYRSTSTPMIMGQKNSFEFKTPNVLSFFLKTPKTDTSSLKTDQIRNDTQEGSSKYDNSTSKYISCPSNLDSAETPFRSMPLTRENMEELPRSNSRKLNITKDQEKNNTSEYYTDNHCLEDMELTNVDEEVPDSQSSEINQREKRSDSLKKVRFSDQHEDPLIPSSTATFNMTENEEYFEACNTLSEIKQSLENSQVKIYQDNAKNTEKENRSPDKKTMNCNEQSSASSRVVMMVMIENNSACSTTDLIDSGLKKLQHFASNTNLSGSSHNSSSCSGSITSVDSYYSISNHNYYSPPNVSSSTGTKELSISSNSSNESSSSGGILSAVANAVRSVVKNFSGVGSSTNIEREQVSSMGDITRPSTSDTFSSVSNLASSLFTRPRKRPRDIVESVPTSQRQVDYVAPQIELRSPLAKRPRGWYKIKGREPIARMRNKLPLTSPRGVSSETQVFHQGSLSVGDTVLPLPSRAHQSTQTD
ncbi:hypothetical protein WH47_04486, partial [Habropoda laboriosa]